MSRGYRGIEISDLFLDVVAISGGELAFGKIEKGLTGCKGDVRYSEKDFA